MRILLVEPKKGRKYHTPYPPLGLLKLAAYHKQRGDIVRLVNGFVDDGFNPEKIYITSLFTYAFEPVHQVISYYAEKYPKTDIIVGGIYATLCHDHLEELYGERIQIHVGLFDDAEDILPDYSLVEGWNASILFSSRGCIRKCSYCSVPKIEPKFYAKRSIKSLINPNHQKVILWDNNILASPHWKNIFDELEETGVKVDFNQGLDARLLTKDVVQSIKRLKIPIIRLAYDSVEIREKLQEAVERLKDSGIRGRDIVVYCLYNYEDTPDFFLERIKDLMEWGLVTYPMRYEPLEPRPKNTYVSPGWSPNQLEMIADARRVIGYGGSFPPYKGLRKKILKARNFHEAFCLRPPKRAEA